jgi:hypothetical protein
MYNTTRHETLVNYFTKEKDLWWVELAQAGKENKADRLLFK